MGWKKFINKKKYTTFTTFQLLVRYSSSYPAASTTNDGGAPASDRLFDEDGGSQEAIPEAAADEQSARHRGSVPAPVHPGGTESALPDDVRREILELGLPTMLAVGSRMLRISSAADDESNGDSIYTVASKTAGVKIQKVVDPDVVKLLDDVDLS